MPITPAEQIESAHQAFEALHDTNGRWDLLAEIRARTMTDLSQVRERIRLIKGITNTETSIQLASQR